MILGILAFYEHSKTMRGEISFSVSELHPWTTIYIQTITQIKIHVVRLVSYQLPSHGSGMVLLANIGKDAVTTDIDSQSLLSQLHIDIAGHIRLTTSAIKKGISLRELLA